jgi:regulator of protease activity HflC (stomatin/prohibitin superfamily)
VTNVSVTPYTYNENFTNEEAVLSRDNLKIAFRLHMVWRVDGSRIPLFMERYSTTGGSSEIEKDPDAVVKIAYGHFVREPLRTYARDEVQRRNGMEVKDALIPIGDAVLARIRAYAAGSPFVISSVVVGNVQYPEEVANAVSRKLAATQELQRKDTEIDRTQGAHEAGSPGTGHRERHADYPRAVECDVHSARSDRGAEADGELAESHGGLHSGWTDGRAHHRDVRSNG